MKRFGYLAAIATVAFMGTWPLGVDAQSADDPHHPTGAAATPPARQMPAQTPPSMPGQSGMMGGMGEQQGMMAAMPMMSMMQMMQMMGCADAAGMGMADHVEGRIAFLRTELRISDAQAGAWSSFAAALRANARTLRAARGAMMGQMGVGQAQAPQTMVQRLDAQERWLAARLDGTRTIKPAFTKLYDTLSQDQRKTADEIFAPHIGMGMMPMGMRTKTAR